MTPELDTGVRDSCAIIHFVRGMLERGAGRIVKISSLVAFFRGIWLTVCYSPSKACLVRLTEGLAIEYVRAGVTFTVHMPGMVGTEIRRDVHRPFNRFVVALMRHYRSARATASWT